MYKPSKAMLIAEYELLRQRAEYVEELQEIIDARLIELERLLPEDYVYEDRNRII